MREESHNQSIQKITQQLVEHYHIPVARNKKDVLDTIFLKVKAQKKKKRNNIIQLSPILYVKVAAALVLSLLALHFFTATVAFSGKSGITKTYRLPDHSRIVLLPNSNVSVGKYFWNRKLSLEGTAYFEVEKGSRFKVKTKHGNIEVLGTRFLVSEQEDSLNIQCYSGQVKTVTKQRSFILEPGTQYLGTQTSGKKINMKIHQEYPDFAKFNKSFPNITLSKLMDQLATFFGVQIDIKNIEERNFSGTIQTGKLESALEIVCQSMQLKYRYANKYTIEIF